MQYRKQARRRLIPVITLLSGSLRPMQDSMYGIGLSPPSPALKSKETENQLTIITDPTHKLNSSITVSNMCCVNHPLLNTRDSHAITGQTTHLPCSAKIMSMNCSSCVDFRTNTPIVLTAGHMTRRWAEQGCAHVNQDTDTVVSVYPPTQYTSTMPRSSIALVEPGRHNAAYIC